MALGGVFMQDTDGNLGSQGVVSNEKICGLIFDISKQSDFYSSGVGATLKEKLEGNVIELNSMADVTELGIPPYSGEPEKDLLYGVPYYHINHFFQLNSDSGRLFIMFADCTSNWNAIAEIQRAAKGMINQLGIWTEQSLWKQTDPGNGAYTIDLIGDINAQAMALEKRNSPLSILLSANTAIISTSDEPVKTVDLNKVPSCIIDSRYVTALISQERSTEVAAMQAKNPNTTPVGAIGLALGCLALANVQESIAWVNKFNLAAYVPEIEMGFGDATVVESEITSALKYESLSDQQVDELDDKGYVFLCKYSGYENGVFWSKDQTCSNGDYRTIARNRTMHKSRRAVRAALLPYVNAPLKVDPSTGLLSAAKITMFQNVVKDVLSTMETNEEISGSTVTIDKNQNVLKNDKFIIKYSLVPIGTSSTIDVEEGFALTNK